MKKDNIFTKVFMPKVDTNRFDLSHDVKLSFQMAELVPTCVLDCLPGDVVDISPETMLRFAPLISPVMHRVRVTTHFFFVPTRLLWSEWDKWITGNSDVEAPSFDLVDPGEIGVGSLCDYLGYPTGTFDHALLVSPMAIAAYLKIYDEYYRDQNLQTEKFVPLTAGQTNPTYTDYCLNPPLKRAWEHDYFTSALPFAQKGDAVLVPLVEETNLPVKYEPTLSENPGFFASAGSLGPASTGTVVQSAGPTPFSQTAHIGTDPVAYDPNNTLYVDVQADATDINTLRRAFKLQEWLEKNARGGTRYVENILAHFGVISPDARLQRPEYIGGAKQNMVISEVLSTAQTDSDAGPTPVGQMAGHGISVGKGNRFKYRCTEHGYIIGIINVQPDTAYQQGLHRQFTRLNRLDYAWPTFANIGEQEIRQKEIYAMTATPEATFGYIPRYSEYKFMNSRVAGEMRSSLNFWHLGRIFASDPALNEVFISANPSTRIFAVEDEDTDHIYAHIFNTIGAVRKLPRYGIPQI